MSCEVIAAHTLKKFASAKRLWATMLDDFIDRTATSQEGEDRRRVVPIFIKRRYVSLLCHQTTNPAAATLGN
jgi:hypothetical protein